jgi:hypothetical protein
MGINTQGQQVNQQRGRQPQEPLTRPGGGFQSGPQEPLTRPGGGFQSGPQEPMQPPMGGGAFGAGSGLNAAGAGGFSSAKQDTQGAPTPGPSMLPNQQVAPLTQQQLQAMELTSGVTGGTQNFLGNAMNQENFAAGGGYLNPNNPYLANYFNAAAAPMTQNYQQTIAPNILQQAAQTGTLGSAGTGQAFGNAETALAQGLGNLGAGIYEPAYAQGLNITQQAAQGAPGLAQGQYIPEQQLMQSGQIGQAQGQNVLNTGYQNLYNQSQWPFQELNMLGGGLGMASGGGSTGGSITTAPYAGSGK